MAKRIRSHRARKKTPRWHAILFIIGFPMPLLNVFLGFYAVAWGLPNRDKGEFYVFKGKLIRKLINFFKKPLWAE